MNINNKKAGLGEALEGVTSECSIFTEQGVLLAMGHAGKPVNAHEVHLMLGGLPGDLHARSLVAKVLNKLQSDRAAACDHNLLYRLTPYGLKRLAAERDAVLAAEVPA